jgi:hypothetical protein
MDILIEIIFTSFIVRILGKEVRKLIFKISNNRRNKSKTIFSGTRKEDLYNALVGLIVFIVLSTGIAFVVFS